MESKEESKGQLIKIYVNRVSQPGMALVAFCDINKIPYERYEVNMLAGEQYGPEYKKVNPSRKIPALIDGDFRLGESHTIMRYLADSRKIKDNWYPKDLKKRSLVNQYLDWHHTNLRRGGFMILKRTVIEPMFGITAERSEIADYEKLITASLKYLDLRLSTSTYLCGETPSIADISCIAEVKGLQTLNWDLAKYHNLQKWFDRMMEIEEIREALKDVGSEIKRDEEMKAKI